MQSELAALPNTIWLQTYLKEYSNPKSKIQQLLRKKSLIRLKRGQYLRSDLVGNDAYIASAANILYGPSYISFEYALRRHSLIPEYVANVTSATYKKNKKKVFYTDAGTFFYRDIPPQVYSKSVVLYNETSPSFLIASPEKALCDQLYTVKKIRSLSSMEDLLYKDLRIDRFIFNNLDFNLLHNLAGLYRTETHETFKKYLEKINYD